MHGFHENDLYGSWDFPTHGCIVAASCYISRKKYQRPVFNYVCHTGGARQRLHNCMKNPFNIRHHVPTLRTAARLLAIVLVTLAWASFAAEGGNFDGPRWSLLDADKVLASAKETTIAKYPDSDQATVDKKMVRLYRSDG